MLGEIRIAPAILFYLLYVVGVLIFVSGGAGTTSQSSLLYGGLFGLFCYATFDLTSLSLLKQLELASRGRRCVVGRHGHGGLIDHRASRCQLARAEGVTPHFGCGTIRMYGFGDFQPCG